MTFPTSASFDVSVDRLGLGAGELFEYPAAELGGEDRAVVEEAAA